MRVDKNVFPCNGTNYAGITARDYIAIQAMIGLLTNPHIMPNTPAEGIAKDAYRMADAMIKQSEVAHE